MKTILLYLCAISMMIVNACTKSTDQNSSYSYNVRMTDAPAAYDAVLIDLQSVELTGTNGNTVTLNTNKGIYNLLDLSNGVDTLIATGSIDIATVEQIRLVLGSNNSVIINGISYPLSTPSAEQSGLKLQVHQILQAGVMYTILLDFDANKSIVEEGNGKFKLKPVIRTIETAISGSIKGRISPLGIKASVTATSTSNVSYSSNVDTTSGYFIVKGLPAGTYSFTVTPASPFNLVIVTNVAVTNGVTTDVGTIIIK